MTMTEQSETLTTLHVLKIKGRASVDEVAASIGGDADQAAGILSEFADQELVVERTGGRRPGWMLSPTGRARHEELLAEGLDDEAKAEIAEAYEGFLALNSTVKEIASRWQSVSDDAGRFDLIEEVHEIHDDAVDSLDRAGQVTPRFSRYGERLSQALEQVEQDPRFMVSPAVDSYHTIWFEAHEDFLLTLGRTREAEGSI
jgi:hypothetical protein